MKYILTYHFLILLISLNLLSCNADKNAIPSLKETYSKNDKAPFGAYVLYKQLGQLFYNNNINVKKQKFATNIQSFDDTGSLYVNVSRYFISNRADNEAILSYVAKGNNMFISSEHIDKKLLDTLGVSIDPPTLFHGGYLPVMINTSVFLQPGIYQDTSLFTFFYFPFDNHFKKFDSSKTKVLGRNESGDANFIVLFYGAGRLFLHCEPRAFSNYFLLKKNNYKYAAHAFSFMPTAPQHIYWDDFYNKKNFIATAKSNKTGLAVLMRYPSLSWALWLLLLLLFVYVLFEGKRRQRIIPVFSPNVNTTVAFTETISRLYLQKKDNRNMADKMITYFMEQIRNQYFLNTHHITDDFIDTLSRKAAVTKNGLIKLFDNINSVQQEVEVSDEHLILLNQQIENFYKHKL